MVEVHEFDRLQELASTILAEVKNHGADNAQVLVQSNENIATRYGEKHITQNTQSNTIGFSLQAQIGQKVGMYNGTGASRDKLKDMIKDAMILTKFSPPDPEFPGFLNKQPVYPNLGRKIIEISPIEISDSIKSTIDNAVNSDAKISSVAGSLNYNASRILLANSFGVEARAEESTLSGVVNVAATQGENESRSSAAVAGLHFNDLSMIEISEAVADRAVRGLNQAELEIGKYNTILGQEAVMELMFHISLAVSSTMLINYQSPFKDKLGEEVFDKRITITDDTSDATLYSSQPFDFDGVPSPSVMYIEKGVIKEFAYNLRNAKKLGVETNGKGVGAFALFRSPSFTPGTQTEQELIENTEDGIYVTNIWYANFVNMPEGSITGLTKDGLFRIKDGEIVGSLKNMRFTDTLFSMLKDAEPSSDISQKLHSTYGNLFGLAGKVPSIKLKEFNFSSKGKH
ncbi:MAG: TldD/PmbA family protein [Candidatus Kariarchaeaceae archaeon]|jgi:predicted Zn-dependent protease